MALNPVSNVLAQVITQSPDYSAISPDPTALPGGSVAQKMLSGLMFYALLFTVAGVVIAAGVWAVGAFSNNYTQSVNGKKALMICMGSALAIGSAYFLVKWFYGAGSQVTP